MLSELLWVICIWLASYVAKGQPEECPLLGQEPSFQTGHHNYAIDFLSGVRFPFAIGQCTATQVTEPSAWYKYVCNQTEGIWTVTKTEYSNPDCTGNATLIPNWGVNLNESFPGPHFDCSGVNSYVELLIAPDNQCLNGVTIYAGLGVCVNATDNLSQMDIYCNDTHALAQFYSSSMNETLSSTTEPMPSTTNLLTTTGLLTTNIITTLLSTFVTSTEIQSVCDASSFCNRWMFSMDECAPDTFLFQIPVTPLFGQLISCSPEGPLITTGVETTMLETTVLETTMLETSTVLETTMLETTMLVENTTSLLTTEPGVTEPGTTSTTKTESTTTTEVDKASSRSKLTIGTIVSLILAFYWV